MKACSGCMDSLVKLKEFKETCCRTDIFLKRLGDIKADQAEKLAHLESLVADANTVPVRQKIETIYEVCSIC